MKQDKTQQFANRLAELTAQGEITQEQGFAMTAYYAAVDMAFRAFNAGRQRRGLETVNRKQFDAMVEHVQVRIKGSLDD